MITRTRAGEQSSGSSLSSDFSSLSSNKAWYGLQKESQIGEMSETQVYSNNYPEHRHTARVYKHESPQEIPRETLDRRKKVR